MNRRVPHVRLADGVIGAALAIAGVGEVLVPFGSRQGSGSVPLNVLVVMLVAAALLLLLIILPNFRKTREQAFRETET